MKKSSILLLIIALFSFVLNSQISDTRQKIRLGFDGAAIDHRQILLTIDQRATDKFDYGFDGQIYQQFEDDMYWLVEGKKCVIQAIGSLCSETEIPLGVNSSGGEVSIKIDGVENKNENLIVFLKDNLTGKIANLQNEVFKVELPKGEHLDRFSVTFKEPSVDSKPVKFVTNDLTIYYDNLNSKIRIEQSEIVQIADVNIYNSIGQHVQTLNIEQYKSDYSLDVKPGIYYLQTISNIGNITKKIIIK